MLPALSLHLGEPGSTSEATSGPAHDALMTLTSGGIPSRVITPAEVLTSSAPASGPARIASVADSVAAKATPVPGIYAAKAPSTPDHQHAGTALATRSPRIP